MQSFLALAALFVPRSLRARCRLMPSLVRGRAGPALSSPRLSLGPPPRGCLCAGGDGGAESSSKKHFVSGAFLPAGPRVSVRPAPSGLAHSEHFTSARCGGLALAVRRVPPGTQLCSLLRRETGGVQCLLHRSGLGCSCVERPEVLLSPLKSKKTSLNFRPKTKSKRKKLDNS